MPDGVPAPEASVQGNAEDHRADLKRKADGISRSLSEVFAKASTSHHCQPTVSDSSNFDVHGALEDDKVKTK